MRLTVAYIHQIATKITTILGWIYQGQRINRYGNVHSERGLASNVPQKRTNNLTGDNDGLTLPLLL